jgi:hypothetical protein
MSPPLIGDVIAWGGLARRFESDAEFFAMARSAMPALLSAVQNVLALVKEYDRDDVATPARKAVAQRFRKALTDALGSEPSNTGCKPYELMTEGSESWHYVNDWRNDDSEFRIPDNDFGRDLAFHIDRLLDATKGADNV